MRDYRSWFVADTASALGTTIGGFAFTLVAYAVSHDVTTAGMVGTVFALCEGLGTLPGGHLSDRIDRKKLMIAGTRAEVSDLNALARASRRARGELIGEDAMWAGYAGLYGTGLNIHRSPYSGRVFEYYSEDGILTGLIDARETVGIQSKGVYVYNKHLT